MTGDTTIDDMEDLGTDLESGDGLPEGSAEEGFTEEALPESEL